MTAVAKVVFQAFSTVYSPIKDMVQYMMDKAEYVKKLEVNLGKMTTELVTFYSRKDQIDRQTPQSEERNEEYKVLVKEAEILFERYKKFVGKYNKYCKNLPSFDANDISSAVAAKVLDTLEERKPTILTLKFFKLAELSKDTDELCDRISRAIGKMKQENVLRKKAIEVVQVKHDDAYVDLPSSTKYVEKILRCLSKNHQKIGILGPIGVGKTTIMKRLNNQLEHSEKFDVVIWITYVKEKTTEVIQDAIMERLNLDREKANSIEQNANIISRALENKKYILLIDEVSSKISFNEVGIHKSHEFGKVVIASSINKLIKTMTDKQVEIQPLSMEEALALFREVCDTIKNQRIELFEECIVKSCGGLPLVIKLVATYLKDKKEEEQWSHVKQVLQSEAKAPKSLNLGGIGNAYELVYKDLEEGHKKCLLFVTLFPSDYKIYKDYLVECWKAESYLDNFQRLRSARDYGAIVLSELTDQYLLENHSAKHVKLPVYFRKVALELKYPGEENCLSWRRVPGKIQPLTVDTWKNTKRMSLIYLNGRHTDDKSKIPERPESHNMSTLLMQHNRDLVALGDKFFLKMENLCILDLHMTRIESLPRSITKLTNLICLYLSDCSRLDELPAGIKTLKKLELLDIRGTSIRSLPDEIGAMSCLRCLRITFGQKGCNRHVKEIEVRTKIPLNIISRLHHLEELIIEVGCCNQAWTNIVDGIVNELTSLTKLSTLNFHFPGVSSLEKYVENSECLKNLNSQWMTNTLRSFNISVGCCEMQHLYASDVYEISSAQRQLRLSTEEKISSVGEVLRQASSFELVNHCGVVSLSDFNLKNFGTLEVCVVKCCDNMMSVVNVPEINEKQMDKENDDCAILWCLEKLHLFDLPLLQSIWKGPFFSGSFVNLKVLTLVNCPVLTEILTYEQAKALSSLEHMKVENCPEVVEIIKGVSEAMNPSDILNKVMKIEFVNLSGLQHICRSTSIKWRSLEKLHLFDLSSLQSIWKGPVFSGSFANLKVLTLVDCPELTEILSYEQAKALSSLEHMEVKNCPKVVEIIKEVSDDINASDILKKVMTIEFVDLSGLQHICRSTSIKWRSLVKIAIIRCNRLRDLQMTLSNAEKLEEIKCEESLWTALQFPEKQLFRLRCDSINTEQNPAIQVYYKGESSGSGIPNNHLPNVIVSRNDGQEMERNGKNLLTPNIEQNPAIQLYYKGESSRSGIQNNHLPSNVIVSGNDGQEMERNGKNLLTPNIEQNPAIQLFYKGESSRSGIPNNHLPSNVIVSGNDGQEMERNGKNLTPNTNYGDRVDDHKEEITYHQDALESSQQDRIIPQSTNTNGALSIPEEKSSKTVHCCFWILTVRKK